MEDRFVKTVESITFNSIKEKNFSLSPAQHKKLVIPNKRLIAVSSFLERKLSGNDLGQEVGMLNYIEKSPYYFIRTKGLQPHSFILDISKESVLPIMPQSFIDMSLKKGDLIISKDGNIGEIVILDKDYPNFMLSGALYKLPVKQHKYYLLAFMKHPVVREQLDYLTPKGATLRHCKTLFLDCKIPLPSNNQEKTVKYIEVLTQSIINKEIEIREKFYRIINSIEDELCSNQKCHSFSYKMPTLNEIVQNERIDTNLYCRKFKSESFKIDNYINGYKTLEELGFTLSRGQNLQVSNIGESIYTKKKHKGFYTLILPKFLSKYGSVEKVEYLGNPNKLKTLLKGDLIFGAEGFEKGRSYVVIEDTEKTITNIHGITIQQKESHSINRAIYVKCILDYLREKGMIDLYAVGGNGGSLAQKYWDIIHFPTFPEAVIDRIVKMYYNAEYIEDNSNISMDDFLEKDSQSNLEAGIYNLEKSIVRLNKLLENAITCIIEDKECTITF